MAHREDWTGRRRAGWEWTGRHRPALPSAAPWTCAGRSPGLRAKTWNQMPMGIESGLHRGAFPRPCRWGRSGLMPRLDSPTVAGAAPASRGASDQKRPVEPASRLTPGRERRGAPCTKALQPTSLLSDRSMPAGDLHHLICTKAISVNFHTSWLAVSATLDRYPFGLCIQIAIAIAIEIGIEPITPAPACDRTGAADGRRRPAPPTARARPDDGWPDHRGRSGTRRYPAHGAPPRAAAG